MYETSEKYVSYVMVPKARGSSEVQLRDGGSWRVATLMKLSAARSRRLAKCGRRKCRRWFRSVLLCENSYTYEEYEVEEAEKVLGALRRATHFHSKFLNCTCNKLIRSLIICMNVILNLAKSSIYGFFDQFEANLSLMQSVKRRF